MNNLQTYCLVLCCLCAACSDSSEEPTASSNQGADTGIVSDTGESSDAAVEEDSMQSDDVLPDSDGLDPLPEQPWPIDAPGHYGVGYKVLEHSYTPHDGMERTVRVAIWYPTRDTEGTPAEYSESLIIRDTVFAEAAVAIDAPAPLLLFSHGDLGWAEASFFMPEFFASHGWIAAAPDHTGNTIWDAGRPRQDEIYAWRPQDISATLDLLEALPEGDPLQGLIGDDAIVSGHSFGGYTSLALAGARYQIDSITAECAAYSATFCAYLAESGEQLREGFADTRIKAAIPQAAGNYPLIGAGGDATSAPVLLITGGRDQSSRNDTIGDPYWAGLDGENDIRLDMPNAGHMTFSDVCTFLPGLSLDDGCGEDFISPSEAHRLINGYSMAFARFHLWGDDTDLDLLLGERSLNPDDIILSRKN